MEHHSTVHSYFLKKIRLRFYFYNETDIFDIKFGKLMTQVGGKLRPKTHWSRMQHPASCKVARQHAALLDAYGIYVLNHGCAPTGLPSSKLTPAGSERAV